MGAVATDFIFVNGCDWRCTVFGCGWQQRCVLTTALLDGFTLFCHSCCTLNIRFLMFVIIFLMITILFSLASDLIFSDLSFAYPINSSFHHISAFLILIVFNFRRYWSLLSSLISARSFSHSPPTASCLSCKFITKPVSHAVPYAHITFGCRSHFSKSVTTESAVAPSTRPQLLPFLSTPSTYAVVSGHCRFLSVCVSSNILLHTLSEHPHICPWSSACLFILFHTSQSFH